jgi:hypothetical protein
MRTDRFGNPHAPTLSYARGKILASTEDDFRKLQLAWAIVRERGPDAIFIFTGLEHSLPMQAEDLRYADDEIAPALHFERLKSLALEHLDRVGIPLSKCHHIKFLWCQLAYRRSDAPGDSEVRTRGAL